MSGESLPDNDSRLGIKNGFESHVSFCVLAIKSLWILSQTPDLLNLTSVESRVMACNSLALFAHASASRKRVFHDVRLRCSIVSNFGGSNGALISLDNT